MHKDYPDIKFEWDMHELEAKKSPIVQDVWHDWELKILEGRMLNCEKLVQDIKRLILKQEERLVKHTEKGASGDTMLDDHHLTTRFERWNTYYIDHPAIDILWRYVRSGHDLYMNELGVPPELAASSVQSWGNVLRKGDDISKHTHVSSVESANTYLCSNFCVTADEDTATVYDLPGFDDRELHLTNKPGQIIIFPPWLPHYTTEFEREDSQRITIASDMNIMDWKKVSDFKDGERGKHFIPFTAPPREHMREKGVNDITQLPYVDTAVGKIVNYEKELTEEKVKEFKEESELNNEHVIPEGVDDVGGSESNE